MLTLTRRRSNRRSRQVVNIHQNTFKSGYQSTISNSRRKHDTLSDATNIEVVQDGIPRPRPSTVRYGVQPTYLVIGRGGYRYNGQRVELFMLNVDGVGKVFSRINGGAFTLLGGSFTITQWSRFVQSKTRVYIHNSVDKLAYLDLKTNSIVAYTPLSTPSTPSAAQTNLTGPSYTYYYKIAANNTVGTSIASSAGTVQVGKLREMWNPGTGVPANFVTVSWSPVSGASSYNVYVGTSAGNEYLVQTVAGNGSTSWVDDGSLVADIFTPAPLGDSTGGMVPRWIYNDARNSQIFCIDNENKLWYSAAGTGDFSPYNGGGWIPIDETGDTELNFVDGFRDGKGTPVITVSARGAAGKGKMFHVTFESMTYGDQVIVYGNVYEANGQSAPYAPRAVVKAKDSLIYPTGESIKSTGTSQNINNILTTASMCQVIQPDVDTITLAALPGAVGCEYQEKLFFAFPVGTDYNNQLWYCDTARNNLWVLRWTFTGKIQDLWLYEDTSGTTHFCILIDNKILEFTRSVFTEDDGEPFQTRAAFSSLVWDEDGLAMANIRTQYYKFLNPRGAINMSASGLDKRGATNVIGSSQFVQRAAFTGWDSWLWDMFQYDSSVGTLATFAQSIGSQKVKTNAKMINQLDWEVTTSTKGCDYLLSSVNTNGEVNQKRKLGD